MARRKDSDYDAITTSSEELVRQYRQSLEQEESDASLAVVDYRGGQTEFDLGRQYAFSTDPLDRATGAHILSQLGWGKKAFHEESVDILLQLVTDGDERVVEAALYALGHRDSPRGIPVILPFIRHSNAKVRLAAVCGLSCLEDTRAIDGLIELARDEDYDVRNWAAFGLGTQVDVDTPELRDALVPLLEDEDAEIRGEALIGLAKRRDPRVLPALIAELQKEFEGSWCLEAAELLGDPQLKPLLARLRDTLPAEDAAQFMADFHRAIFSCSEDKSLKLLPTAPWRK